MLQYLHTMIRVGNLETSLRFYTEGLGFKLLRQSDYPGEKFTLAFLRAPGDDKRKMAFVSGTFL